MTTKCTCDFRSETIAKSPYGEPERDLNCVIHGDSAWEARQRAIPIQERLRKRHCINHGRPFEICSDGKWGVLCVACEAAAELDAAQQKLATIESYISSKVPLTADLNPSYELGWTHAMTLILHLLHRKEQHEDQ